MTTTWMPIYWGDYFKKTFHLTTEEHGAYFLLMGYYWQNGKISRNIDLIKKITGLSEKKLGNVIKFFRIDGLYYVHDRIEDELRKAAENKEKKSLAGKKGMQQRYNKTPNTVITELQQSYNPSPSPSSIDTNVSIKTKAKKIFEYPKEFEEFWKEYPPNDGSKKKAFESWSKSIKENQNGNDISGTITNAARDYRCYLERTRAERKFTAHASTWLNQARWETRYEQLGGDSNANVGTPQSQPFARQSRKSILDDQYKQALAGIQREAEAANPQGNAASASEGDADFVPMLSYDGDL
jgi:uncharacterized protein YdaU (DUF1376 family)